MVQLNIPTAFVSCNMVGTVRTYLQRMTVRAVRAVSSTVYPYIYCSRRFKNRNFHGMDGCLYNLKVFSTSY